MQSFEHPYKSKEPSSQSSGGFLTPFPQTSHLFGFYRRSQLELGSIEHVDEQPSPDTKFPSSHVSIPLFSPSPQIGKHGEDGI